MRGIPRTARIGTIPAPRPSRRRLLGGERSTALSSRLSTRATADVAPREPSRAESIAASSFPSSALLTLRPVRLGSIEAVSTRRRWERIGGAPIVRSGYRNYVLVGDRGFFEGGRRFESDSGRSRCTPVAEVLDVICGKPRLRGEWGVFELPGRNEGQSELFRRVGLDRCLCGTALVRVGSGPRNVSLSGIRHRLLAVGRARHLSQSLASRYLAPKKGEKERNGQPAAAVTC